MANKTGFNLTFPSRSLTCAVRRKLVQARAKAQKTRFLLDFAERLPHFVFFLGGLSAYICHRIEEKASNKRETATFALSTGILSRKTVSIPVFRGLLSRFHKPRPSPSARHFVVFSPHPNFSNRQGDIFSSFFVTQSRLFEHTARQRATGAKRTRATACETSDNNKRPFDSTNGIKNVNLRLSTSVMPTN